MHNPFKLARSHNASHSSSQNENINSETQPDDLNNYVSSTSLSQDDQSNEHVLETNKNLSDASSIIFNPTSEPLRLANNVRQCSYADLYEYCQKTQTTSPFVKLQKAPSELDTDAIDSSFSECNIFEHQTEATQCVHPNMSTFQRRWRYIREMRWQKLLSIILILGGLSSIVLSATILSLIHEIHSKHNQVNHEIFGKQYRQLVNLRQNMVDQDTPDRFLKWNSSLGEEWNLVFSDEFNCENRTFYPGDDQFWEAVDIHYAATENMEWLDPAQITTLNGSLRITMEARKSHNLNYTSGMLQSWNKLCFTQGYIETSIRLPGTRNTTGLWPAFWSLGNLARAGYMASTEGTWPYSYETCDYGVTPNQSSNDGLSFLPGQKLNACVCKGEDHPNPGTGRAAPEIDIMEGLYNDYAQTFNVAPFDIWRYPDYEHIAIPNPGSTYMNSFMGTNYQEAVSAVVKSNEKWYDNGNFVKFGMEYRSDMKNRMDNYINFYVNDVLTFRITEATFHPDGNVNWRLIPKEPMSLVMNLGLSNSWSAVDLNSIEFPVFMDVDYVRIYQAKGKENLTCDPPNFPTSEYIKKHINAYTNANLTSWKQAGYEFPKYSLDQQCPK